ncbi:hypothetical protein [Thiosulfatihalobacter marinus]|uniref:hypothetical protein n=1 Tax=Thiosulfatihalobacter marinus TaxID=2792481 RepID=UPI0018D6348D|nr:hypothetical protein [Thiosulfatihalobacter marinus]
MSTKADLQEWVSQALRDLGGEAHLARIAEHIWNHHEDDLRKSGDLFFTWQYDMRWAAQNLQKVGKLRKLSRSWRLL